MTPVRFPTIEDSVSAPAALRLRLNQPQRRAVFKVTLKSPEK